MSILKNGQEQENIKTLTCVAQIDPHFIATAQRNPNQSGKEENSAYPLGTHDRFNPFDVESMLGQSRFGFAGEAIFTHP